MDDITLGHQAPIAVATVFALDYLKKANWFPWINKNSEKLNRSISLIVALGTAAGLKVMSGDAQHGWVLAIPPLQVLIDTAMHAVSQFGGQELLHKLLGNHQIGKDLLEQVGALQKQLLEMKGNA